MLTSPSPTSATALAHIDDVDEVRTFVARHLPLSGHVGGLLEAWGWDRATLAARCLELRHDGELAGLYVRGRVLRACGEEVLIAPGIAPLIDEDTRAVMGPTNAVTELALDYGIDSPRIVEVWETRTAPIDMVHVRVPGHNEIPSFAAASYESFTEEIGFPPAAHPEDRDYLDFWQRALAGGRLLGVWRNGRCVFRVEIRPVLGMTVELRGLWLAAEERGHGLAQTYLREVLAYVGDRFAPRAQVLVARDNRAALRLYPRVGMTLVGNLGRIDLARGDPSGDVS